MTEVKELTKEEFRKMQLMQLDMIKELDRVCRKHNIKYTIFAGTLLGAVRHKGYIPWDDDADIAMLREEYEKFKLVADELDSSICYFQDHTTDPNYRWGYAKLRRTNTEYIRVGQEHLKCKTGFFIDIFPMDDIPKSTIGQVFNDFYCFCLRKILYSEVGKVSKSESKLSRKWYSLLSKIPTNKVWKRLDKMTRKSNNSSENRVRIYLFPSLGKSNKKNSLKTKYGMPKEWFLNFNEYDFEENKFYGTADYDSCLKYLYDDYMKLPPEDKREQHSPTSSYSFDTTIRNKIRKDDNK